MYYLGRVHTCCQDTAPTLSSSTHSRIEARYGCQSTGSRQEVGSWVYYVQTFSFRLEAIYGFAYP